MKDIKIKSQNAIYTGGNIYLFYGELENKLYFIADSMDDIRIVNANPLEIDETSKQFVSDDFSWQESHLIYDLDEDQAIQFMKELYTRILKEDCTFYKGLANYSKYDIEQLRNVMN